MRRPQQNRREHGGFDAAVERREDDHLLRWPFAKEIAGIALHGPENWCVRVGVYGEWGTGKTLILKFVDAIANEEDHVVVWFNPWEFSSRAELWRSFVLKVYECLELKVGGITAGGNARRKSWLLKIAKITKTVANVAGAGNEQIESGLELVKEHLSFGPKDLETLRDVLGKRRVVVLIDDLDRTAAELVPEILFALKELMDIPAFSFVCAFDPLVVGKVLRHHHRGFGDGLKFLEKIIDYPRWLPSPSKEGLLRLALAEAQGSCEFVPEQAIRDAIPLLPSNPRAVRQFIRLLALLRPQIDRHHAHELRWPVIIVANVLKVRHPRLAYALLDDDAFWEKARSISILSKEEERKKDEETAIAAHVDSKASVNQVTLTPAERTEVLNTLSHLCSRTSVWLGGEESLSYQMSLAEAPHAVTWKEFDELLPVWRKAQSPPPIRRTACFRGVGCYLGAQECSRLCDISDGSFCSRWSLFCPCYSESQPRQRRIWFTGRIPRAAFIPSL